MVVREIIGLIAGIFVMLSYFFEGKKLRIVNIIGSLFFVIYGLTFKGISIILLNGGAVILHLYYILKEEK